MFSWGGQTSIVRFVMAVCLRGEVFYRRVWGKAREAVLPGPEFRSPAGQRAVDLRTLA